ncbi:MAG TPA: hypothetical protein VF487_06000 [Chitinophagaceae bacterium]
MRHSFLTMLCFVLITQTATSQFTITPRLGVESSRTLVSVNDGKFFAPLSSQFSPQASLRMDYKFRKGHGIFAGISTNNTTVAFNFSNPEASVTSFFASRSTAQLRSELGYQFTSKPEFFKKTAATKSASTKSSSYSKKGESNTRQSCGSYSYRSSCADKARQHCSSSKSKQTKTSPMNLRFQPQVGLSAIHSPKADFTDKLEGTQTSYAYHAGNGSTALITGMGFEFAKGNNKLFVVNIQYLKGIGNLNDKTLTTSSGGKSLETNFASRTSAWSLNVGVPLTLSSSKASNTKNKSTQKSQPQQKRSCGQSSYRSCIRI